MVIAGIPEHALRYIAGNLREQDARELNATLFEGESLVERIMPLAACGYLYQDRRGIPVAVGGLHMVSPGVAQAWIFGTPGFRDLRIEITRHARDTIAATLLPGTGVHRVQAYSVEWYTESHQWLRAVGFRTEPEVMRCYGKGKETFLTFIKLAD